MSTCCGGSRAWSALGCAQTALECAWNAFGLAVFGVDAGGGAGGDEGAGGVDGGVGPEDAHGGGVGGVAETVGGSGVDVGGVEAGEAAFDAVDLDDGVAFEDDDAFRAVVGVQRDPGAGFE